MILMKFSVVIYFLRGVNFNMKKILYSLCFVVLCIPYLVFADTDKYEVVSETTKYYKTVSRYNTFEQYSLANSNLSSVQSETFEVSKEEYDLASDSGCSIMGATTIETTYRYITSTILTNGSYYRYKNLVVWKSMPSLRSYDIIGIGFLPTVKLHGNPVFEQEYCSGSSCYTSTSSYKQTFSTGVGATFKLASGSLSSLRIRFYFDVEKNTTATIINQRAYSDYLHAESAILLPTAMRYQVNGSGGIIPDSSASSYYERSTVAGATWSGSW